METSMQPLTARNTRAATAVALAAFVGYLVVPSPVRPAVVAVMVAAAAAAVACTAAWMRTPSGSWGIAATAIGSAVGLVGSVAYLHSVADEPAAIPIVGSFVLLASLIGLVVTFLSLRGR
jgi:hypothetical protein